VAGRENIVNFKKKKVVRKLVSEHYYEVQDDTVKCIFKTDILTRKKKTGETFLVNAKESAALKPQEPAAQAVL
jgi:hypothetical protein